MDRGGAEMRTLELMRHLDRSRFHLEFCCTSGVEGELAPQIRDLGGQVHTVPLGAGFGAKFRALLRQRGFEAVHSHLLHTSGLMLQNAARVGIPVRIAHFRSTDSGRKNTLRRRVQRAYFSSLIGHHATHILAVSEAALQANWKSEWRSDERCQVIYNGIDLAPFNAKFDKAAVRSEFGIAPEAPLYIHVGNLRPPKNHARLLEIFATLVKEETEARLLLVGRGEAAFENDLRRRATQLGLDKSVIFAGERNDVPQLLRAADLMLFPSLWEGLPGAVLEAGAAGLPVLASALPVVQEIAPCLGGLKYLALSENDQVWANTARAWRRQFSTTRSALAQAFAEGPFNLDDCVRAHDTIWESARQGVKQTPVIHKS
jgi:glycosyltransferase involved in cell wall biosynthesis